VLLQHRPVATHDRALALCPRGGIEVQLPERGFLRTLLPSGIAPRVNAGPEGPACRGINFESEYCRAD
jgi:hypothetical protein